MEHRASPQGFAVPLAPLEIHGIAQGPGEQPGLRACVVHLASWTHRGVCFHSKTKWQFRKADPAKENPGKPRRMKQ